MIKKSKKEQIYNTLQQSSFFLLIVTTLILIITNLLFVFNITITPYHLPIIYIFTTIGYMVWKKKEWKKAIIAIAIASVVFIGCAYAATKTYDGTPDGNTYHKLAVGALKNGWNPLYESVGDFNKKEGNPFDVYKDNVNVNWVDHYARGTETFGAVVYAFSGNIETGKMFNLLWIYIGLFIIFGLLKQMNLNNWKSLLVAIILAFNPIMLVQIANYYLDGVLAISLFIIILCCLLQFKKLSPEESKMNYLILGMAIIWCCNAKFTGLAFAAVFCGVYYLYKHIKNYIKDKNNFKKIFIKDTIFYVVTVLIAVLIVGGSTYTKNMIDHGNPLYPLYGKGHVDNMVMMEIPKSLQDKNRLTIFLTSIFAKGENVSPSYSDEGNEPDLKVPLTFTQEELDNYSIPDIRMGGFGPLFSAIFILSIIGTICIIVEYIRNKNWNQLIPYIITLGLIACLILFLDGGYWSRYIPYFYLVPAFVLIHYLQKEFKVHKVANIFALVIVIIFIINSGLIFRTQYHSIIGNNEYVQIRIDRFKTYANENKNKKILINLQHHGIQGVQYNIDDLGVKNYKLTDKKQKNDGYMFTY